MAEGEIKMNGKIKMKILIDIGGSGVKIKWSVDGVLCPDMCSFKPTSREEFYSCICEAICEAAENGDTSSEPDVEGIAVSICGEYDYGNHEVVSCWHYPFLKGKLRDDLEEQFECWNVHIVNDGDAHALALKAVYAKEGLLCPLSAVNLSLGTAVGFGILDWKGDLLHNCRGHNWEVGNWQCDTRESCKDQYWVLGSQGLRSLEEKHGDPTAYIHYGQRICHFLVRDLVPLFHPKIIGLSGGIVARHRKAIEEGINRECEEKRYRESDGPLHGIDIHLSPERDSVMLGLAELLDGNCMTSVFGRFGRFLRKLKSSGEGKTTISEQDSYPQLDDDGFNCYRLASLNEGNEQWSMCATSDELVSAIRGEQDDVSEEQLQELIKADGAYCRAPHAWRALCWRHGEALARRLIFEKALCDCSGWEVNVPENRSCAFVGIHAGKVVCAENAGNEPLAANRSICLGAWELFTLVKNKDGSFSLKSSANDKYVSANPNKGGLLIAEGSKVDEWEKFDIKTVAGKPGIFTFRARSTQKFVSADETLGNVLIADRDVADAWEEFRIYCR